MQRCLVLILVNYYMTFLPEIHIVLKAMLLKLHAKLALGWVLIQVIFHPIQEIGSKLGGGLSFVSGPSFVSWPSFARLLCLREEVCMFYWKIM